MSIERRRKERATVAIVEDRIREGYHPSFGEVVGEMTAWAAQERPERPYTKKQWVYANEVVERDMFVDFFTDAIHDANDLRAEAYEQTARHLELYEMNRVENLKVEEKARRVERKLRQVLLSARAGQGQQIEVLRAHGEGQWSEREADAMIDVAEGAIRLHEVASESKPILLNGKQITVKALRKNDRHVSLTGMDQMMDGNLNTAWWHVLKTEDPGNGESRASVQVTVALGAMEKMNFLKLATIGKETTELLVETSLDGTSFKTIPGHPEPELLKGEDIIRFIEVEGTHIRLTFSKTNSDEFSAGSYHYYFAIQEIYLSGKRYVKQGSALTEPIVLREGIKQVAIETTSSEPSGTSLTYFVAAADPLKDPKDWTWIPISPAGGKDRRFEQTISISDQKEFVAEFDRIEKNGEVLFGQDVHVLSRADGQTPTIGGESIEKEDVRLYRGIGQWKVERRFKAFTGDAPMRSDFSESSKTRFIPFGNTLYLDRASHEEDNLFRFTATLFSDGKREQPLSVGVIYQDGGYKTRVASYSVYVNGKRMPFESDRYRLPLEKGWNVIELVFHVGDMNGRVEFDRDEFPTELYIGQWDTVNERMVRGEVEGLKRLTKSELYQKVETADEKYFALEGGKTYIFENDHGALYQMIYVETNDAPTEVSVKVDLERGDDPSVTPEVREIVIKGSVE